MSVQDQARILILSYCSKVALCCLEISIQCVTCGNEIMDHWLRHADDPDLRAEYWCTKEGSKFSLGLTETMWDVSNELVSKHTITELVCKHTSMNDISRHCSDCNKSYKDIINEK
jgi:hypothetical protein